MSRNHHRDGLPRLHGAKLEDLATGLVSTLSPYSIFPQSLGPNGDLVNASGTDRIDLYRDGGRIGFTTTQTVKQTITDGINIAYSTSFADLWLYQGDAGGDIELSFAVGYGNGWGGIGVLDGVSLRISGGYVAFVEEPNSVYQVFLATSDGGTTQVSPFATHSQLETLAPNGQVTFFNPAFDGPPSSETRYLSVTSAKPPDAISHGGGWATFVDGGWLVAIGGALECITDDDGGGCFSDPSYGATSGGGTTGGTTTGEGSSGSSSSGTSAGAASNTSNGSASTGTSGASGTIGSTSAGTSGSTTGDLTSSSGSTGGAIFIAPRAASSCSSAGSSGSALAFLVVIAIRFRRQRSRPTLEGPDPDPTSSEPPLTVAPEASRR